MDRSHSPALEPVCSGLKTIFDTVSETPPSFDLDSLTDALDAAYLRGDLFSDKPPVP